MLSSAEQAFADLVAEHFFAPDIWDAPTDCLKEKIK